MPAAPAVRRQPAPVIALLSANAVSMAGNVLSLIAIPWFVLQTTQSPARAGLTGFAITLGSVVAAFFGGAIVDRLGFRRVSLIADVASGVTTALIPLLHSTIGLEYWQLLLLVFAGSLLDAPGTTAREALLPDLAELAGWRLEQAGAALQAVERGARMVGAPLAGLLIAAVGTNNVLWFNAASFGVSALVVRLLVPALKTHAAGDGQPRHYWRELKEGLDYIRADRFLFAVLLLIVAVNFLDAPSMGVLFPVYVRQFFGQALNLGLMLSASGAGAVVSAVIYGLVGHRVPRRALFFGAFLVTLSRYWVLALVPPFWGVLAWMFISGLGSGPINPILTTLEYERIPPHFRGRVLGTITAVAWVAMPLGVLLGGYALEVLDVRAVMLGIGAAYLAAIGAFWRRGGWQADGPA